MSTKKVKNVASESVEIAGKKWHLAIISCGKKKQRCEATAGEMYTGAYHRACQEWARTFAERLYILSAKHGFLPLGKVIAPYNLRLGDPGAISRQRLELQALLLNILHLDKVVVLGGQDYVRECRRLWPDCDAPLAGVPGIGKQIQWLKKSCALRSSGC